MVSRRKILSRSRDNLVESQYEEQDEEDIWYNLDKLYKVNSQLIHNKSINFYVKINEIMFSNVICMSMIRRYVK